ncbi:MAG: hypothetical protein ABEI58_01165, partial [Candidatus Nanohaloarchaea archaeon]
EHEEFESRLGNVAVTKSHIERDERVSEKWNEIMDSFSSDEIIDKIHFSEIEEIELNPEFMFPNIRIKTGGDWKRMFFFEEETAENCFKTLRYRLNSFRQVFG